MPQVWLTYKELGDLYACDVTVAQAEVIQKEWPRRSCGDGRTRVKLPVGAAHEFMLSYAAKFERADATDAMVSALRDVLGQRDRRAAVNELALKDVTEERLRR
jgi:hypothetical protein